MVLSVTGKKKSDIKETFIVIQSKKVSRKKGP